MQLIDALICSAGRFSVVYRLEEETSMTSNLGCVLEEVKCRTCVGQSAEKSQAEFFKVLFDYDYSERAKKRCEKYSLSD